jgi:hypothetical protein
MYFYQIKCCFSTQNGCMKKKILQQLIPSQIPDRFNKLLCSTVKSVIYIDIVSHTWQLKCEYNNYFAFELIRLA